MITTKSLRQILELTQPQAAALCGVSSKTWQRYERNGAPKAIYDYLQYLSGYQPGWDNMRVLPGRVITTANETVTANHIDQFWYLARLCCDRHRHNKPLLADIYRRIA